jgi:N-acetylglucosaminyldiphosphoundecaprenol N-acetyl-beta-D-mannosaminyltransferase
MFASFSLIGVRINPLAHEQILSQINEWICAQSYCHTVIFANTHVVMESRQNPKLGEALAAATLVVPDGMPIMLAARSRGHSMQARADGPGLMRKALTREECKPWRHYFYGGTQEVLSTLLQNFCDAQIAGMYAPPFRPLTPEEDAFVIDQINASKADVLWVGLGCPKQERWMFEHAAKLQVPVLLGVGQAFDILAGVKKRAPAWMCATGLEWLYRLLSEPRRLWKRYLLYNPWFIWLYGLEQIRFMFDLLRGDRKRQPRS